MMELLWLLLPVAAASGGWTAWRACMRQRGQSVARRSEYFKGLNYLIDDKPDQAIEVFTHMADVDRDTAEIHLTLGNLFRRRGEVERAIHIHTSLMARDTLTLEQRCRAALELGEDYLRAGLFDRAEALFRQQLSYPEHIGLALSRLIHLFQQEKDWPQAISACDRLEQLSGASKRRETAHFCCELAELSIRQDNAHEAKRWLHEALTRDPLCARANVILGQLLLQLGDPTAAIVALQAVEQQDRDYLPEIIVPLGQCYRATGAIDAWMDYLWAVQQRDHSGRMTDVLAEWLLHQTGEAAALQFLERELQTYPTWLGVHRLVEIRLSRGEGAASTDLQALHQVSSHMLKGAARYRCAQCGFVVKSLHWCCPSCQQWNTIKPMPDLVPETKS